MAALCHVYDARATTHDGERTTGDARGASACSRTRIEVPGRGPRSACSRAATCNKRGHHRTLRCALYVLQLRRALHVGARLALATARGAGRGNQLVLRGARADVGAEVRWRCDMRYMHTRGLARMLRA